MAPWRDGTICFDEHQVMNWHPAKFFTDVELKTPYALLLLNQSLNESAYKRVVGRGMLLQPSAEGDLLIIPASMITCGDGGANQLYDIFQRQQNDPLRRFPDAIVGDLDSLRDDVRDFFQDAGRTQIVRVPDQDSTDFTKALRWLKEHGKRNSEDRVDVVVFGCLGGRVDQGFSIVHHLFKAVSDAELLTGDIYLLSEQSLSFVLEKGRNLIHGLAPGANHIFQESVGIIPVRGPAVISTKGLEWDVKDWKTELGGQLSTSNHIKADVVEIEASDRMLFTIELANVLCTKPH
ncbi:hypothetical protein EPUS_07202 [Endocarpon pusillum Z07020]|uniref:Thiamine pyrophosphokinase n=1 Tax=Endocarpon pusillum (strain Z07020 / HMAS-L-300199) TaxID=1263415 RepID=U1GM83_ENDPU|nr:uncharacterized protein EPUS_07202 [Endocarpon pusillum Z07020]ERF73368.1 hypothetical protein EPUS_07202 [Endocarpon pusillum Z07020]